MKKYLIELPLGIHFFNMGHPLYSYFRLFYVNVQLLHNILPMLGFEPLTSGIKSDSSTNEQPSLH